VTETLSVLVLALLVFGLNTSFWTVVGLGRFAVEQSRRLWRQPLHRKAHARHRRWAGRLAITQGAYLPGRHRTTRGAHHGGTDVLVRTNSQHRFCSDDVAILIPAHNEAAVLEETLRAASKLLPLSNIHVVSDGSTDRTAEVGREFGAKVLEVFPNRGKAGALLMAISHFELARNFQVLLLLDADTRLAPDYLKTGLREFDDPEVVAVAGRVKCLLDPPPQTRIGRFLVAYRARLYAVVQLLVKYGQAVRWANAVSIVPGFASMYRTDVLDRIDIAAPGLVIEDFNMTFEVHAKKLGRIAFGPNVAVAYTQDPDIPRDYVRQIRRWSLGFWQTVRLHGVHVGRFWLALTAQIAELICSSVLLLLMVPLMLFTLYSETLAETYGHPGMLGWELVGTLGPQYVLIGFLLPDVLMTVFASIALRRPSLLLLSPLLPAMRLLDAYVCLRSIPTALRTRSSGSWVSPTRREAQSPTPSHDLGKLAAIASGPPSEPDLARPARLGRAAMRGSLTVFPPYESLWGAPTCTP
jgi:biofilm PGA synthesis N-glycosyltransferase PgaC